MAPAALLCTTGTVQSLCQSTASSSNVWQAKRSVSSGAALNRACAEAKVDGASVKSCLPASIYESRRRLGVRHVVRSGPSRHVFTAAVEGNVAVEEPSTESEVVQSSDEQTPEVPAVPEENSASATTFQRKGRNRRGNPRAKREEPTVLPEALVPGAVFTGKVTTIQPFGAFVNFGAFTDGLVHISKLSSGYVSNVGDIVSVGQEVQVTVIDVDNAAGRIALSMAEKEEKEGSGRQGGAVGGERSRPQEGVGGRPVNKGKTAGRGNQANRRDEPKKPPTKLVKGQAVEGTVKNSARGGVYVLLPEEEEGFLKYSEIPGGENMAPEAGLQPGQKVNATVLRIDRGRIILSMKPVVDLKNVNSTINKGADGGATNPFEIAFRAMDLIPEKEEAVEKSAEIEAPAETEESTSAEQVNSDEPEAVLAAEAVVGEVPSVQQEPVASAAEIVEETKPEEVAAEAAVPETAEEKVEEVTEAAAEVATPVEKVEAVAEAPEAVPEAPVDEKTQEVTEAPPVEAAISAPVEEKAEEVTEAPAVGAATPAPVEEKPEEVSEAPAAEAATPAPVKEKAEEVTEALIVEADTPTPVEEQKAEEATDLPVVEAANPAPVPAAETKQGGVSAAIVKQLRDETGAGMMDCKKALADSNGDLEKAREFLRKKGLASADKKASRIAAEGLVGSYIHDSRIGILIEVNCETDFVARGQAFRELVADLGMQVVASSQVKYVSVEDIPAEIFSKETELEMQREDLASKPEAVRAKIVEGRVSKRLNEFVLLEQPYIRNDSILVKDLIKQTISSLGENIKVRRFERYNLGEGLEKKSEDFAAEVAAQTSKTAEAVKVDEKPAEAKPAAETAPAAPTVAISAAVVKELRETTGAGMMDCKKALAATGNDLQMAVEYLRKKGLASADKKASRLASEGLIGSYIHNGVIGVLVEVNCETDFVSRSEKFKELVRDIAMQVAACPSVTAVSVEDVPAAYVEAERAIELGKEDLANKPEAVRSKIVDGRVNKRISELALLEQPFIKDDSKLVKDVVKETVAALGENIQVRRFTRFNLGDGIEKKVVDFAAEVAAQTGQTL